jgi:hypothetical protein
VLELIRGPRLPRRKPNWRSHLSVKKAYIYIYAPLVTSPPALPTKVEEHKFAGTLSLSILKVVSGLSPNKKIKVLRASI